MRYSRLSSFTVFIVAAMAAVVWAGEPIPDIDVILEQNPGGIVKVDSPVGGFDEILLDVGKPFAAALSPAALPSGWTLEAKGKRVRLAGPAVPAGTPVRFKLDPGEAPRPKRISYEAKLEGKTVFQRKDEVVELVPPQQKIGSLQGIVTVPSQVAPGEPMQMRVTDMAALPAGGTWSLSGTVVDEAESDESDSAGPDRPWKETGITPDSPRRSSLSISPAADVPHDAMDQIATVLAMTPEVGGPWEVVALNAGDLSGAPRVTIEEEEVYRAKDRSDVSPSRIVILSGGGTTEGGSEDKIVMFDEEEKSDEKKDEKEDPEKFLDYLGGFCFERLPSTGDKFELEVATDPDFAWDLFPCTDEDRPDQEIRVQGSRELGDDGFWHYDLLATNTGSPTEGADTLFATNYNSTRSRRKTASTATKTAARVNPDGTVNFKLPEDLAPGGELALQYVDRYGDVIVDVPSVPGVEVVEPSAEKNAARIIDVTPRVFAGQQACIWGLFPSPEAWNALLLDDAPFGQPISASSRMAWVQIPATAVPGAHIVSGAPEPGFPSEDRVTLLVLQIGGEIDSSKLQRLETTPMRLWVRGTSDPVEIRVRNRTPGIISIEGGADQTILTSGGEQNMLERRVQGLAPGAFDIGYELAGAGCPCASADTYYW